VSRLAYFFLSDTLFEVGFVTPLADVATGAIITSGAVTVDLHNQEATDQPKIGDTLVLDHVAAGAWRVNIPDDFHSGALVNHLHVIAKLSADSGSRKGYWELEGVVETQKGDTVT
jgi:hypothetical protein